MSCDSGRSWARRPTTSSSPSAGACAAWPSPKSATSMFRTSARRPTTWPARRPPGPSSSCSSARARRSSRRSTSTATIWTPSILKPSVRWRWSPTAWPARTPDAKGRRSDEERVPDRPDPAPPRSPDDERRFRLLDEQMRVLERERQKLSAVVSHTDAGFLVFDPSLQVTWTNNIFATRFCADANRTALRDAKCHQVLCGRPSPCEACPAALPFRSGTVAHQEMRLQIHEQTRHIYATAMPIKSLTGKVEQTILMVQDLTDLNVLRQSKEALEASEARFRSIFEQARLGMATATPEGRYLQVNPAFCKFLGYERDELLQKTNLDVTHPDDRARTRELMQESLAGRRPLDMERRYLRKDGTIVWGYLTATWLMDADGRPSVGVGLVQDIDERKRVEESLRLSEEQFLQAQKMEAVGRLAGGVAHDFNNLLTAIMGYSDLSLRRLRPDDPLSVYLTEIKKAGERAAPLTRQLLAFSRKQVMQPKV